MKSGSRLEQILESGGFAVTAELGPPRGVEPKLVRKKAELLNDFVDAVNITDNQTAIVRLSSIAAGVLVNELGLEPVIQMVTRDRNRIALQSDLIGAAALGLKNVLCLSGDHQTFGDHPQAKNVHDIDSIQLINAFKNLRDEGRMISGKTIKNTPKIFIGAAANPFADPLTFRVRRLAKKIKAGADFIQTQAVFDVKRFKEWMAEVRDLGLHRKVHILAGVIPVKSVKLVQYMKENVAGVMIPDELVTRMTQSALGGKDAATAESRPNRDEQVTGVEICLEIINQVKQIEGVHGIHIMAVGWEEIVPSVVEKAGLLPRPKMTETKKEKSEVGS